MQPVTAETGQPEEGKVMQQQCEVQSQLITIPEMARPWACSEAKARQIADGWRFAHETMPNGEVANALSDIQTFEAACGPDCDIGQASKKMIADRVSSYFTKRLRNLPSALAPYVAAWELAERWNCPEEEAVHIATSHGFGQKTHMGGPLRYKREDILNYEKEHLVE
jgi:hypothetical protein